MNHESIKASLRAAGIGDDDYIIGGSWDDRICLAYDEEAHIWQVYNFERGNKFKLRQFDNEEAAYMHLYARLVEWYVMTKRLVPAGRDEDERLQQ